MIKNQVQQKDSKQINIIRLKRNKDSNLFWNKTEIIHMRNCSETSKLGRVIRLKNLKDTMSKHMKTQRLKDQAIIKTKNNQVRLNNHHGANTVFHLKSETQFEPNLKKKKKKLQRSILKETKRGFFQNEIPNQTKTPKKIKVFSISKDLKKNNQANLKKKKMCSLREIKFNANLKMNKKSKEINNIHGATTKRLRLFNYSRRKIDIYQNLKKQNEKNLYFNGNEINKTKLRKVGTSIYSKKEEYQQRILITPKSIKERIFRLDRKNKKLLEISKRERNSKSKLKKNLTEKMKKYKIKYLGNKKSTSVKSSQKSVYQINNDKKGNIYSNIKSKFLQSNISKIKSIKIPHIKTVKLKISTKNRNKIKSKEKIINKFCFSPVYNSKSCRNCSNQYSIYSKNLIDDMEDIKKEMTKKKTIRKTQIKKSVSFKTKINSLLVDLTKKNLRQLKNKIYNQYFKALSKKNKNLHYIDYSHSVKRNNSDYSYAELEWNIYNNPDEISKINENSSKFKSDFKDFFSNLLKTRRYKRNIFYRSNSSRFIDNEKKVFQSFKQKVGNKTNFIFNKSLEF